MLLQDRCGSIGACLCRARKPEAADRADESEKQPPLHDRAQTRPGPPRKHPKFSAVVPALALRSLSDLSGCRVGREALVRNPGLLGRPYNPRRVPEFLLTASLTSDDRIAALDEKHWSRMEGPVCTFSPWFGSGLSGSLSRY